MRDTLNILLMINSSVGNHDNGNYDNNDDISHNDDGNSKNNFINNKQTN